MLDSFPVSVFVGSILGFLAGLGVGGGSLLILWLTLVLNIPQQEARSLNLLFFLPAAFVSCLFRWKQGNVVFQKIWPGILAGCIAAGVFSFVGNCLDLEWLKKLLGGLLIFTGLRELLYKPNK